MTAIPYQTSSSVASAESNGDSSVDGADLLRRFSAMPIEKPAGSVGVLLAGLCTFGVLPLVVWIGSWWNRVNQERELFASAAEFFRSRGMGDRRALAKSARSLSRIGGPKWIPIALVCWLGLSAFRLFAEDGPLNVQSLVDLTYTFDHPAGAVWWWSGEAFRFHKLWLIGLSVAYVLHYVSVRKYIGESGRFVRTLNAMTVPPFARFSDETNLPGSGLGPVWIIGGLAFISNGVWWAIPMVLAGALQRRYITVTGPQRRFIVSRAIENVLAREVATPERVVTPLVPLEGGTPNARNSGSEPARCPNTACQTDRRPGAVFCHRCGAALERGHQRRDRLNAFA